MIRGNDAKDFFEQCRRLEQRINAKVNEAARLRDLASRTTANYSDMPRGSDSSQSRVENAVLALIELEQEINRDIDEMVAHREKAKWVLASLSDDRHRDVLTWRYFALWTWEKIAEAFGYDDRTQVWRLHGRALLEANHLLSSMSFVNSPGGKKSNEMQHPPCVQ